MIQSSQHVFLKEKSCLTNLIAFYNEVTGLVDEEEAVDIYLDSGKTYDPGIHTDRAMKYRLY